MAWILASLRIWVMGPGNNLHPNAGPVQALLQKINPASQKLLLPTIYGR
jgi:hypothetical protein